MSIASTGFPRVRVLDRTLTRQFRAKFNLLSGLRSPISRLQTRFYAPSRRLIAELTPKELSVLIAESADLMRSRPTLEASRQRTTGRLGVLSDSVDDKQRLPAPTF